MHPAFLYAALVLAGFVAGIVNTIAGGGSFLTLPALLFFGLEPKIANATNRIAILFSTASATATFHRHGHWDQAATVRLAVPTLIGVPIGGWLAIALPPETFKSLFGILFLAMAALLAANPKRFLEENHTASLSPRWRYPAFFAIGVYVGFIQAGMGILLLIAMSFLCEFTLVQSNAIKNSIGFIVTLAGATIFAVYGLIDWVPGLVMAVGNVTGGFVGAKLAIKKGNRWVFVILIIVMVATGIKLLVV